MPLSRSFEAAFAQNTGLRQRVYQAHAKFPDLESLFEEIAQHITNLKTVEKAELESNQTDHASKKRKLEHRPVDSNRWNHGSQTSIADVSFSIPQRKKFTLELNALAGIRATSSAGGSDFVEFLLDWGSVQEVFCLPLPEKAQAQYNFCVLSDRSANDQILWTVPDTAPKDGIVTGAGAGRQGETYRTFLISIINQSLKKYKKSIVEPSKDEFASQIVQAHRKGETAFHVKAFRGSKDGYLFFLPSGILWGFKKPLEFFAFDSIESVSYTSVLQRTFNLNVVKSPSEGASTQEFEFSMVDQADFGGIDAYIKRHALQDASMAEQRRAKKLNINGVKGGNPVEDGGDQGEGELEKARREAEDLEDEEEEEDENFDPGSEGESEGSGSSSEEDEDASRQGPKADLVEEELGSEAEMSES